MEKGKISCPKCGSEYLIFQDSPKLKKKNKRIVWWLVIGWWQWIIEFFQWILTALPILIIKRLDPANSNITKNSYAVCQYCGNTWRVKAKNELNRKIRLIQSSIGVVLLVICLSAIILSPREKSSTDMNAIYTQAVEAAYAGMTQTALFDPGFIHTQVAGTIMADLEKDKSENLIPVTGQSSAPQYESSDLSSYCSRKYQQSSECSNSLNSLSAFLGYIGENPNVLLDESITGNVSTEAEQFKISCTNFHEDSVPQEANPANEYMKLVDQEYLASYDAIINGLANYDVTSINNASIHLTNAANYLTQATSEIEKIK